VHLQLFGQLVGAHQHAAIPVARIVILEHEKRSLPIVRLDRTGSVPLEKMRG